MLFPCFLIQNLTFLVLIIFLIKLRPTAALKSDGDETFSIFEDLQKCSGYSQHPLVLLSVDGFRSNYLERGRNPALQKLRDEGVSTPFLQTSYPSKTFPNHYSIVTGLYPESHGIIGNKFSDPVFNETFSLGSKTKLEGKWYGGDPIWNTVVNQGRKSATFFWPGSDVAVNGVRPTYYRIYNSSVPFEDRVNQVLEWLELPEEDRPIWICLYFKEPDWTGHHYGPNSNEVNAKLEQVDNLIKLLVDGVEIRNLTECVNLMVVSDHGMSEAGEERVIPLEKYLSDDIKEQIRLYSGAFPMISLKDEYKGKELEIMRNLSCKQSELDQYRSPELPKSFHFSNNPRIEDIIIDLDPGFTVNLFSNRSASMGQHGYDPRFESSQAIFIARGPDFASGGKVVEPFQNIELYNLMCELLNIKASPNNGTEGYLNSVLKRPATFANMMQKALPPIVRFPENLKVQSRFDDLSCAAQTSPSLNSPKNNMMILERLNLSAADIDESLVRHLPWGIQYHDGDNTQTTDQNFIQLIVDKDRITGYSRELRQPLWSSFTVESSYIDWEILDSLNWFSDIRLDENETISCQDLDNIRKMGYSMEDIFPTRFSSDSSSKLISNAVPMTSQLSQRWFELIDTLLVSWVNISSSPVNVVIGLVYDNNYDSHADDLGSLGEGPHIPTEIFMVITRCQHVTSTLSSCRSESLDAIAFIYPQFKDVQNCQNTKSYARKYSAKVKDVELATNLQFYPKLGSFEARTRLILRIHQDIWPTEENRVNITGATSRGGGFVVLYIFSFAVVFYIAS